MHPRLGWVAVVFVFGAFAVAASPPAASVGSQVASPVESSAWSGELLLDGWGGLHHVDDFSPVPVRVLDAPYWPGWDIARGVALTADHGGGFVLDGWGGLHWFSLGARRPALRVIDAPSWPGRDVAQGVALMPDGSGGLVLDGCGGLHWFSLGSRHAAPAVSGAPSWPGWNIARGVAIVPDGTGGYVLDGWGGLHWFSLGPAHPPEPAFPAVWTPGRDHASGLAIASAETAVLFGRDASVVGFGYAAGAFPPGPNWVSSPRYVGPAPVRDGAA